MKKHTAIPYIGPAALNKEVATVDTAWTDATIAQREIATKRELFLQPILEMRCKGIHANVAIRSLLNSMECNTLDQPFMVLANELGKDGKLPSRSTIHTWLSAYEKTGRTGLLNKHTGRVRKDYGWEAIAVQKYNRPGKPSMAAVARELREEGGFTTATDKRVRTFLQGLPAQLGENSPARIGRHKYNNSQKPYVHRTTENMPVGAIYQGDGHTLDVYLEHPVTHDIWRSELTVWMDIRSRYIVGWYLSKAESAISTIYALSRTLVQHNHVPAFLYIDNGSGYKSKMMTDECVGYYKRMGIETIFSIPGNAKGKGNIERFFRTMERDFNVRFGEAYCGENMAAEVNTDFVRAYKAELNRFNKGEIDRMRVRLPSREEWMQKFATWLDHYHNRPHPEEKNTTPAQLWATLQHTPVNITGDELLRPSQRRTIQRGGIRMDNRWYVHQELVSYNGADVMVEYSLDDDVMVTVRDLQGRLICDAPLVRKKDYIPVSRIEEAQQKSLVASHKRLQKKMDEQEQRSRMHLIDQSPQQFEALERYAASVDDPVQIGTDNTLLIDTFVEDDDSDIEIDILNPDY